VTPLTFPLGAGFTVSSMEVASLAPKAEVTIHPWKDSQEHIDEVVEHARRFLKAHEPISA
jgi:hypothetical protein